jgi:SET domain-containing protein
MSLLKKQLSIQPSGLPGAGNGLFTTQFIPKGTLIIEYKGKISAWKDVHHDNGNNGYIYYVNRNHVIDASKHPNELARYANDARGLTKIPGITNNAEYTEDGKKVFIRAKKNIQPGEEILVAYGKEYWQQVRENIRIEKRELAVKK